MILHPWLWYDGISTKQPAFFWFYFERDTNFPTYSSEYGFRGRFGPSSGQGLGFAV